MPPSSAAEQKLDVAMLVYSGMVLLDMVGPQTILQILGSNIHLVSETKSTVSTDVGVSITPTTTFAECPKNLDVLFVPGGLVGTIAMMGDEPTIAFLADRGARAQYVTSVCTGSLVLGAAGLLRGYRATSHWGVAQLLTMFDAIPQHERVVHDRNRLTGAGVTAGIDFGLTLAALLRGVDAAKHVQLTIEYSPQPPFKAGTPQEVGPAVLARERQSRSSVDSDARKAAEAAAARLAGPLSAINPAEPTARIR